MNKKKYKQLIQKERDRIFLLKKKGKTNSDIAKLLGRDKTTIGRELKRNTHQRLHQYLPDTAQRKASKRKEAGRKQRYAVKRPVLKKSARHLSKPQKTSLDLFSTKLILEKESKFVVEQFMSEYFVPEIDKNEAIRGLIQQYVHIERLGAFFPILIQELTYLGSKVFLSKPSDEVVAEVKSLVEFLEKFSEREVGDTTTADTFVGKYMRCAIRIVASRAVRERGDITSHKERINYCVQGKFENIYIIGSGVKENKKFMDEVAGACLSENDGLEKVREYQFRGQIRINSNLTNVNTYLIHLHNPGTVKYLYEANDIDTETR